MKLLMLLTGVVCSYGLKPAVLNPRFLMGSIDQDVVSKLKKVEDILQNVEKTEDAQQNVIDNVKQEKNVLEKFFFNIKPSNILGAILSLIPTLPPPGILKNLKSKKTYFFLPSSTSPPQTECDCGLKAPASGKVKHPYTPL